MKTFIRLGLAASLTTLTLAQIPTEHRSVGGYRLKRGFETCQETYGGGSVTCGDSSSHYCYDPTLGETCCLLDDGYCKLGNFCAPVAGFCCHNGEGPATCAARLSFTLPPSSATASAAQSSSDIPAATTTSVLNTSTVEVVAVDSTSTPFPSATFGVLGEDGAATTSKGMMTPDFTAMINQTAPSATSSAGLGPGVVAFTGAARRVDLGLGVGSFFGIAAVAGLVL